MRTNRTLMIADGENLLLRYQAMLDEGAERTEDTLYDKDIYAWHPQITRHDYMDLVRVSFYTTCVGDAVKIAEFKKKINSVKFVSEGFRGDALRNGRLVPHVFKKEKRSAKTKSVDINITIDALRHTYNGSIDTLYLLAGDGDYIPLIQEVMRQGKRVVAGAFSDGLNPELPNIADDFLNLDKWMIKKK